MKKGTVILLFIVLSGVLSYHVYVTDPPVPQSKEKVWYDGLHFYEPVSKRCFETGGDICDPTTGICTSFTPSVVSCPLDFTPPEDRDPVDRAKEEFYREILETDTLPSEQVIEDAKKARDEKLEKLRELQRQTEEEIVQLTKDAREASRRANADAVRAKLGSQVTEETIRDITRQVVKEIKN